MASGLQSRPRTTAKAVSATPQGEERVKKWGDDIISNTIPSVVSRNARREGAICYVVAALTNRPARIPSVFVPISNTPRVAPANHFISTHGATVLTVSSLSAMAHALAGPLVLPFATVASRSNGNTPSSPSPVQIAFFRSAKASACDHGRNTSGPARYTRGRPPASPIAAMVTFNVPLAGRICAELWRRAISVTLSHGVLSMGPVLANVTAGLFARPPRAR